MNKPMIRIHDISTDEVIDREMNAKEFEQYKADQLEQAAQKEIEANKLAKKTALLERLGITEDEARLLLG